MSTNVFVCSYPFPYCLFLQVLALTWDLSQQFGRGGKEGTGVPATEDLTVEQVEAKIKEMELADKVGSCDL